ncbi:MAG: response regulator transcription factor [Clostridiaceae bacterium]
MKKRILIVEDEVKIARFLELELNYEGYETQKSHDGRMGLEAFKEGKFDLVLLDIMLPSMSGIEVLRRIRTISEVPVIMLTAKDQTIDKVTGLDLGADDYVTKPFEIEELLARIRVALKRNGAVKIQSNILTSGKLKVNLDKYTAEYEEQLLEFTKREFELLRYLLENKNRVLSREKIVEEVWGYDYIGDTNVVDVYIRYLRSKLDERFKKKIIYTVRGVGYMIKDE